MNQQKFSLSIYWNIESIIGIFIYYSNSILFFLLLLIIILLTTMIIIKQKSYYLPFSFSSLLEIYKYLLPEKKKKKKNLELDLDEIIVH